MKNQNLALFVLTFVAVGLLTAVLVTAAAGAQPAQRNVTAPAQVAYPITYQGRLTNSSGSPVASQALSITFSVYGQQSGGTAVWTQTGSVTTDANGLFTTELLVDPPLGVSDLSSMYLGVKVGTDPEMSPRQRIGGAAYAFTLVPGNGISGTVNLADSPNAILSLSNIGTGHGLAARTEGSGVGVYGYSKYGFAGYFTSTYGHALAVNGPVLLQTNLRQVALHRWYPANEAGITFTVEGQPMGIFFDGGSLWVTSYLSDTVTRLRASDGAEIDDYPVGNGPIGVTYDGGRIWVANQDDGTVTRISAANPAISSTITVGGNPNGLCFDGHAVWVTNKGGNNLVRVEATTGVTNSFTVGASPRTCTFDGNLVWVANYNGNTIVALRPDTGAVLYTVSHSSIISPTGVVFDGANVWVANYGSGRVAKIRAGDGTLLANLYVGGGPRGITFDGYHVWVTQYDNDTVAKLRVSDGSVLGTYNVENGPRGITFDGSDIWVVNSDSNTIIKK